MVSTVFPLVAANQWQGFAVQSGMAEVCPYFWTSTSTSTLVSVRVPGKKRKKKEKNFKKIIINKYIYIYVDH